MGLNTFRIEVAGIKRSASINIIGPEVKITLLKEKETFVPLGISSFEVVNENEFIEFECEVLNTSMDEFTIEILHNNKVVYTAYSAKQKLDEVVVTAKAPKGKKSEPKNETPPPTNYAPGKYNFKWDGFDSNSIYDSALFTSGKLKARIKGSFNGLEKTAESEEFSFEYKEVKWVDVKINKFSKRADVSLRVNLKDGGAEGLDCKEIIISPNPGHIALSPPTSLTKCPWDNIPASSINASNPIIKTRIKSFEDLKKFALDGINYHWGRNQTHAVGKFVTIKGDKYEIYLNSVNTEENSMDDVDLIFNTNNDYLGSSNPGTVTNIVDFFGQLVPERISYNVGYIKISNNWYYRPPSKEDNEFKYTSAHELGHTILKAFGGVPYSFGHKGSSTEWTQKTKPTAPVYPSAGEIDVMIYYRNPQYWIDSSRVVATEKDTLSLIWISKLELK